MMYEEALSIVNGKVKDSVVVLAFRVKAGIVFSMRPRSWTKEQLIMDPFFLVEERTGKVKEYAPLLDLAEFKDAIVNNVLYKASD